MRHGKGARRSSALKRTLRTPRALTSPNRSFPAREATSMRPPAPVPVQRPASASAQATAGQLAQPRSRHSCCRQRRREPTAGPPGRSACPRRMAAPAAAGVQAPVGRWTRGARGYHHVSAYGQAARASRRDLRHRRSRTRCASNRTGKHPASDEFPVIKLNRVGLLTGIYDYNLLTSAAVALIAKVNGAPANSAR